MTGWRSGLGSRLTSRRTGASRSTSGASIVTTRSWMCKDIHTLAPRSRSPSRKCGGVVCMRGSSTGYPLAREWAENCSLPLSQRVQTGECDLLVLVGLHARDADRADAFVLVHDRQRALDQDPGRKARKSRPVLHAILEEFARTLGQRRGSGFADRHFRGDWAGAVHALEAEQVSALIDDGARHIPPVFHGFGLAGLQNFLHVGQRQTRFRSHGRTYRELAFYDVFFN